MKDFSSYFKQAILELVSYCLSNNFLRGKLWQLADRGALFELFQSDHSDNRHISKFCEVVRRTIEKRQVLVTGNNETTSLNGRYLAFDPNATMYDGLIEELTSGFFDSDDVPPPEFWVGMDGDKLISFIPENYLDIASEGVENCMSGCLHWVSELVVVKA